MERLLESKRGHPIVDKLHEAGELVVLKKQETIEGSSCAPCPALSGPVSPPRHQKKIVEKKWERAHHMRSYPSQPALPYFGLPSILPFFSLCLLNDRGKGLVGSVHFPCLYFFPSWHFFPSSSCSGLLFSLPQGVCVSCPMQVSFFEDPPPRLFSLSFLLFSLASSFLVFSSLLFISS